MENKLSEEWEKRAETYKQDLLQLELPEDAANDFLNGATLYANSVEKLLNDKKDKYINAMEEDVPQWYKDQIAFAFTEIEIILKELTTIKPE